jgi:DNA-binding PadR family transcriptional regulator
MRLFDNEESVLIILKDEDDWMSVQDMAEASREKLAPMAVSVNLVTLLDQKLVESRMETDEEMEQHDVLRQKLYKITDKGRGVAGLGHLCSLACLLE